MAYSSIIKAVHILEKVNLSDYSTMRLGGKARYLSLLTHEDQILQLLDFVKTRSLPFIVIGHGSNIVWRDEGYKGLVIVNQLAGRKVVEEDKSSVTVRFGAGVSWDDVVAWAVSQNLSGIEFLSAIPGTAGGGPIQNIGAYGAELANTLVEVEAYDTKTSSFGGIAKEACEFGYRTSRFKTTDKNRFIITGVVLKLSKSLPAPPFYESVQKYFDEHSIKEFTPKTIRSAVIAIRKIKLPDPSVVANNGSFFINPIIDQQKFDALYKKYPGVKGWPHGIGQVKVSAGWLVEQAGFRGVHDQATGMATNSEQALVLINEHAKSTADLLKFKQKIVGKVQDMFGITLQQEPELLP